MVMGSESTKQRVYIALSEREGVFISGEELSGSLGLSRTAVWKAITALKEAGHSIEATKGHGYRLVATSGDLSAEALRASLNTEVEYHGSITSTNDRAKEKARTGALHGSLVVADGQTSGRGRLGRVWHSPAGKGLWFSIILRPGTGELPLSIAHRLTGVAALAARRGIMESCGIAPGIKWPNDMQFAGRKVGGILLESGSEAEFLSWAVVGIGLNVSRMGEEIPEDVRNSATSIGDMVEKVPNRTEILISIHNHLLDAFKRFVAGGWMDQLDELRIGSCILGREVSISRNGQEIHHGFAEGLDDEGALLLRIDDGRLLNVNVGDVSLRTSTLAVTLPR